MQVKNQHPEPDL